MGYGYQSVDFVSFLNEATRKIKQLVAKVRELVTDVKVLQENGFPANFPIYSDNAAALSGGLAVGAFYRTSTGNLKVIY